MLLCMHVTFTFDSAAAAADSTDGLPAAVASFYSFTRSPRSRSPPPLPPRDDDDGWDGTGPAT
eukprot:SAG25_NODE_10827_length_322_cov_0.511211_1_plen_62_part_01